MNGGVWFRVGFLFVGYSLVNLVELCFDWWIWIEFFRQIWIEFERNFWSVWFFRPLLSGWSERRRRTETNRTKLNETKWNQTKPNETKWTNLVLSCPVSIWSFHLNLAGTNFGWFWPESLPFRLVFHSFIHSFIHSLSQSLNLAELIIWGFFSWNFLFICWLEKLIFSSDWNWIWTKFWLVFAWLFSRLPSRWSWNEFRSVSLQFWLGFGWVLVEFWLSFGPFSISSWLEFGQSLPGFWLNFWLGFGWIFVEFWSIFYFKLTRIWSKFAWFSVQF